MDSTDSPKREPAWKDATMPDAYLCDTCGKVVDEKEAAEHRTIKLGRFELHHEACCPWCNKPGRRTDAN